MQIGWYDLVFFDFIFYESLWKIIVEVMFLNVEYIFKGLDLIFSVQVIVEEGDGG